MAAHMGEENIQTNQINNKGKPNPHMIKGTGKLYYVIVPNNGSMEQTMEQKQVSVVEYQILHSLKLYFVDKLSLSVALRVIKDLTCGKRGSEFVFYQNAG